MSHVIEYEFATEPGSVIVPVTWKLNVSPFLRPENLPVPVSGSLSYTLDRVSVTTVIVAGIIVIVPFTYLRLSLDVTSSPSAFLITRVSQSAVTVPSATCVAVSFDAAAPRVYPLGRVLTLTVAP